MVCFLGLQTSVNCRNDLIGSKLRNLYCFIDFSSTKLWKKFKSRKFERVLHMVNGT